MIKIKMKQDGKAIIRFKNEYEEQWLFSRLVELRDMINTVPHTNIHMSVKNTKGEEAPKRPVQKKNQDVEIIKPAPLPEKIVPAKVEISP